MGGGDGEALHDERVHPRREWDLDVGLGQAEEAPVGAHHPEVVAQGEHGARREGVAVAGGNRDQRELDHPGQQLLDLGDELTHVLGVGPQQPLEVEAVAVELALAGGDQRTCGRVGFDLVERGVHRIEPGAIHPVLVVPHVQDIDVAVPVQLDHRAPRLAHQNGSGVVGPSSLLPLTPWTRSPQA